MQLVHAKLETETARLFAPHSTKATTQTVFNLDIHNPAQDNNLKPGIETDILTYSSVH